MQSSGEILALPCSFACLVELSAHVHLACSRMSYQEALQDRRTAVLLCAAGAAGLCLGSIVAYSCLSPAAANVAEAQKPHRRRTTGGQDSEPNTPRRTQDDTSFESYQLMLVVNEDQNLEPGKLAVHCSHACVAQVKKMYRSKNHAIFAWDNGGGTKLCVKAENEAELIDLRHKARDAGLSTFTMSDRNPDSGHTHATVLAIGPGSATIMDEVLGQLPKL